MKVTNLSDSVSMGAHNSSQSQLLSTLQRTATERLADVLDKVLQQADDYLFDSSSRGDDGAELTALRDLRRVRAQLTRQYGQALTAGFLRLQGRAGIDDDVMPELTLLEEDALEEQLATEQMIENLNRKYAGALELLDRRLAVLLHRQSLETGDNPVAPGAIGDALRAGLHAVELSTSVRIALYKFAERELTSALAPLYERLNVSLAEAGILPQLRPTQVRKAPAGSSQAPTPAPAQPQDYGPGTGIAQPVVETSVQAAPASDSALFGSLLQLLQSWRQRSAPDRQGGESANSASQLRTPEIMSVLSVMQSDPPPALDLATDDSRGSLAEQLRKEVLAGAMRLGVGREGLNLSNAHEDAVDLVGMLFDVLLDERDFEPAVRRKIGRMVVPYVKVAVKDRRLFLFKGHPARRFLNAVAEACVGNHGEVPQERELLDRVDASIERVVNEFNEDMSIFETLEHELREFLAQHHKRIEVAERRAVEAQNGRERLELSRSQAAADLDTRRDHRHLPFALDDFLGRYASHHLVQVALREGRDSARYGSALTAIQKLLAAFDHAELGMDMAGMPALDHSGLADILSSYGCDASASVEIIEGLEACLHEVAAGDARAPAKPTTPPHEAPHPGPRQAAAVEPGTTRGPSSLQTPSSGGGLKLVGGHDQLDFDPDMAERMRALKVGTWLQLHSETGRVDPAKVSWISPISSRFLLVNRRGIRVLMASAEELAAMAKRGRVQLRMGETAFDDAMHQVVAKLQTDTEAA